MIDTILFDLDGTLLAMDQDLFVKTYFEKLCQAMAKYGWDPKQMAKIIGAGCMDMMKNDGSMSNEERFWIRFEELTGKKREDVESIFLEFYKNEFQQVREIADQMEHSAAVVRHLKQKGYRVILATNPLFPQIATHSRLRWAGLEPEDFDWVTTYENSSYSKPERGYYEEILEKTGTYAENCLMVGNNIDEDMCTAKLGMAVYLVTDYLIDEKGVGTEGFPHGSLEEFRRFAEKMK